MTLTTHFADADGPYQLKPCSTCRGPLGHPKVSSLLVSSSDCYFLDFVRFSLFVKQNYSIIFVHYSNHISWHEQIERLCFFFIHPNNLKLHICLPSKVWFSSPWCESPNFDAIIYSATTLTRWGKNLRHRQRTRSDCFQGNPLSCPHQ